jgi:dipeptidyl aminopeptidase/acylaminoacyl peptidase
MRRILFSLCLFSILCAPVIAQTKRAFELKDYYRIESAESPALSPDGRWAAFVRSYILEAENRRQNEIWLASTDGSSKPVRLTDPAVGATAPRWSPDGKLLAFTSRRRVAGAEGSESDVWFLRMEEPRGEPFQVRGVGGTPIFSPDNQWIAFTKRTLPAEQAGMEVVSEFELKLRQRFKGRVIDWMNYRSDGRGYLPDPSTAAPNELYLVARAGGVPRQATKLGVDVQSVAWRPDSKALVIAANAYQRDENQYERSDLWVVSPDGAIKRLTDDGFNHIAPVWSPDGKSIFFLRSQSLTQVIAAKQNFGSPVDLYRMPAEGGAMQNLTSNWDLIPGAAVCSADGRFLYFSGGVGGNVHLFRAPAAGGAVEQATQGDRALGGFSFSAASDRIAYTATDPAHPGEVFTARLNGGEEKKLSNLNDALLDELEFGKVERLLYQSKDGTQIEGWALLPRGYAAAKGPYPLILNIHGGPHGAYGPGFSAQFQLLAAHGYIVLYTNPRGSTGYGEKFLWGTWGGWGDLDTEDVMAGVDAAIKRYAVDEKRLGVTGYSYGGFLTNWIITHSARFAAAVTGAGVSNWISDYGTADIARTKESEFYGPPWESKSGPLLIKQSPITYAARVTTPTLFVHGESDLRVPIEQAEQMYLALKKRGVPARFIRYPDSYHGGWSAWNTVHRYHYELLWWEKYLGVKTASGQ